MELVLAHQALISRSVIQLLVVIVVLGVCLWLVNTYVPMAPPIKTLLTVVVVLLIVLMLLRMVGLW
jgi:hypothetical protein